MALISNKKVKPTDKRNNLVSQCMDAVFKEKRSVARDLTFALALILTILSVLAVLLSYLFLSYNSNRLFEHSAEESFVHLKKNLELHIWNFDFESIDSICESFFNDPLISEITVIDSDDKVLYKNKKNAIQTTLSKQEDLFFENHKVGKLFLGMSSDWLRDKNKQILAVGFSIVLVVIIGLIISVRSLLIILLRNPISYLLSRIEKLGDGDYEFQEKQYRQIEIATILEKFNLMEVRIHEREKSLEEINSQLEQEIEGRKQTDLELKLHKENLEELVDARTTELNEMIKMHEETESALRLSELNLNKAQEVAHIGSWVVYFNDFGFDFNWSEEVYNIMGIPVNKRLRKTAILDMVYPEDRTMVENTFRDFQKGKPFDIEHRIIVGDKPKWVHLRSEVEFDQKGKPYWGIGTIQDIHEQKLMKARYNAQRLQLQYIFDSSPMGIAISTKGIIRFANPAYERIFGLKVGDSVHCLYTNPADMEQVIDVLRKEGKLENYEIQLNNKDRQVTSFITTYMLTSYDDEEGILGWFVDITERKQMEQEILKGKELAEAATRAKSSFLANMSHELRTPLNAILGFSQLMVRSPDISEAHKKDLNTINRSGEHLLGLINDVLDISKIEAGKVTVKQKQINLEYFLKGIVEMFTRRAKTKGIDFILEKGPDLPRYIETDEGKFRQILINLLGNAVKFTEKGSITLRINSLVPAKKQKKNLEQSILVVEVEDTGIGIEGHALKTIFNAFEQISDTKHTEIGTGLGLTICNQFIKLLGGHIRAESELRNGARFIFEIPVKTKDGLEVTEETAHYHTIPLDPNQPTFRILIVEDIVDNRVLIKRFLEEIGFEVAEAHNGKEAITVFKKWAPHLIFMDLRMPVMDGYEATKIIKATIEGKKIPIIALTASAFASQTEKILTVGCDDIIHKPFKCETIYRILEKYLPVDLLHEDTVGDNKDFSGSQMEIPPSFNLKAIPADILEELKQATIELDSSKIELIINKIKNIDHNSALVIEKMSKGFQYDEILKIVQLY